MKSVHKSQGKNQYPSVTQVLSPFQDFSAVRTDVLEYAAWRGSEVHKICACIARDVPYLGEIPASCVGYVKSFQDWWNMTVESVHVVEERLVDPDHGYQGQPDLVVTLVGDKDPSLWDLKTPLLHGHTWGGQLAAYRNLARKAGYPVIRCGSLRLDKEGGTVKIREYDEAGRDFSAFLAALTAYRYFNPDGKRG